MSWHRIEGVEAVQDVEGVESVEGIDPAKSTFPVRGRVDDVQVLVFRVAEGFRGVEPNCPHQRASLTDAVLMTNGTIIRCPRHNFAFRLSDGKGVNCAGLRLKVYEVRDAGGRLEIWKSCASPPGDKAFQAVADGPPPIPR